MRLFAQAAQLAPHSADPTALARLYHYRGLDAMNQGKLDEALTLLTEADQLYAVNVPDEALKAKPAQACASAFAFNRSAVTGSLAPDQGLISDPRAQSALLGLIEVRRNRAVVLRVLGKPKEADDLLEQASDLARGQRTGTADPGRQAVPHHGADIGRRRASKARRWPNWRNRPRRSVRRFPDRSRWRRPICCAPVSCCGPVMASTRCRSATSAVTALTALKAGHDAGR